MTAQHDIRESMTAAAVQDTSDPSGVPPPLSMLCAWTALLGGLLNQVLVPGFSNSADAQSWLSITRCGDFLLLTSALAGCVALGVGVLPWLRNSGPQRRQTLAIAGLTAVILYVGGSASLLDRSYTEAREVFLGLGAAHLLGFTLSTGMLFHAKPLWLRIALGSNALFALAGLVGQVAETIGRSTLIGWQMQTGRIAHTTGEVAYWAALCALTSGVLSRPPDPRRRAVQLTSLLLLGVTATSYALMQLRLGKAFSLILYSALRVRLFLESWPTIYGIPICVGLAAGFAGLLAKEPPRRQTALAVLLLLAAGYAPKAPAHMLTFSVALLLAARVGRAHALAPAPYHESTAAPSSTTP